MKRMIYDEIASKVKDVLPKKRYNHSLGVAYMASSIAMKYGEDYERAQIAGVLHDCAKYLDDEKMISECKKYGIEISEAESENPQLLHAKVGAYYAEHIYGVSDEEILSAIRCHTTGKPDMTFLEKCLFVADYIEIHRTQPSEPPLDEIRKIAFTDLDMAVYLELVNVVGYVKGQEGQTLDENSVKTLEYYEKLIKSRN